jgi:DNA-binding CsgD family transcriptional regulator
MDLSPREKQVAVLLALDHSNREIAKKLGISVDTVNSHLAAIYRKTGAASRLGLAVLAIGSGLVTFEAVVQITMMRAEVNRRVASYDW